MEKKAKTGKVVNCPHCTKIIFKECDFIDEGAFTIRCPHCQKEIKVKVKKKIEIILTITEKLLLLFLLVAHSDIIRSTIDAIQDFFD